MAYGATVSGGLVEVLASQGGRTWTLILTGPDGMACPAVAGETWRQAVSRPEEPDA